LLRPPSWSENKNALLKLRKECRAPRLRPERMCEKRSLSYSFSSRKRDARNFNRAFGFWYFLPVKKYIIFSGRSLRRKASKMRASAGQRLRPARLEEPEFAGDERENILFGGWGGARLRRVSPKRAKLKPCAGGLHYLLSEGLFGTEPAEESIEDAGLKRGVGFGPPARRAGFASGGQLYINAPAHYVLYLRSLGDRVADSDGCLRVCLRALSGAEASARGLHGSPIYRNPPPETNV